MFRCRHIVVCIISLGLIAPLYSQQNTSWRDPSQHAYRYVTADKGIRLEVLDWGGSGRPVILLSGGGNTAHVFDDFAPKLGTSCRCHVYGITRRGFGSSGFAGPVNVDRLGEDVLTVIGTLKLKKPVLVGHSIAGAEMSSIAVRRPDRVAGLVYLEAAYPYAFTSPNGPAMKEFLVQGPQAPDPSEADLSSFATLQSWEAQVDGFRTPEAELRQIWDSSSDGRPGKARDFAGAQMLMPIMTDMKEFTDIPVLALAIFAIPHEPENWIASSTDPAMQKAAKTYFTTIDASSAKQARALEHDVPNAQVVGFRGAHYIFLSNEKDVLREMERFFARLM